MGKLIMIGEYDTFKFDIKLNPIFLSRMFASTKFIIVNENKQKRNKLLDMRCLISPGSDRSTKAVN